MSAADEPLDARLSAGPNRAAGEARSGAVRAVVPAQGVHRFDEPGPTADWAKAGVLQRAPARLGVWLGVGVALIMAVGLTVFALGPTAMPAAYRVASMGGGVPGGRSGALFLPHSRVRLVVVPVEPAPDATPLVWIYVSADGAPLELGRDVRVMPHDGAFRIEAEAGTLFGTQTGPKTLFVGLALEADALESAAGMGPSAARGLSGVRWLEVPLTYQLVAAE